MHQGVGSYDIGGRVTLFPPSGWASSPGTPASKFDTQHHEISRSSGESPLLCLRPG